jgi:translation initiation factor 1
MGRLVYSTETGRLNPDHENHQEPTPGDGNVRIRLETKGRKGKGVTVITGVPLTGTELKKLLKELKQKTSTGGAIKGANLELQGDQRDKVLTLLSNRGYTSVKLAGG